MLNLFQESGSVVDITVTADIASGGVVIEGNIVGVAQEATASGEVAAVLLTGIVELAADTSEAFAVGDSLFYDSTNEVLSSTETGNTYIGVATATKATAGTTGFVLLGGVISA